MYLRTLFQTILVLTALVSICHPMPHHAFFAHRQRNRRNTIECYPGAVPEETDMRVFLTVSSLAKTSEENVTTERLLELNWYNDLPLASDRVGLYNHDPTANSNNPLEEVAPLDHPDKYFLTSVMFSRRDMKNLTTQRQCLDYWIAYVRQGRIVNSNCLRIEPNWMWDNRHIYAPIKFKDMMIPGTHDAGSYAPYNGSLSDNIFYRWILTQEEDFFTQMMYGIRHFDLRLAYYSETPQKFWINHDIFRVNPFHELVNACKKFLNSTKEIIILDFHQFPVGFKNREQRHFELIDYIIQELGSHMLSPSVGSDVTMDAIWQSDKRLIVAYSDAAASSSDLLWPGVKQLWAQTVDINYLKVFFDSHMHSGRTDIWSAQLELTPTALQIFSMSSLRILADQVNRNVTEWCRDMWWDEANLVAVDFFLGTNIIEVAIEANRKRRNCIDFMIRTRNEPAWTIRG